MSPDPRSRWMPKERAKEQSARVFTQVEEKQYHIIYLELLAVFLVIQISPKRRKISQTDNYMYVAKGEDTQSPLLVNKA